MRAVSGEGVRNNTSLRTLLCAWTWQELFAISRLNGKYPQVFVQDSDAHLEFVGGWDEFVGLLDNDNLPADVQRAHPHLQTFRGIFGGCLSPQQVSALPPTMANDENRMASPASTLPGDESVDDEMVQLGAEAREILSQVEAELRGAQGPLFQQCLTALVDKMKAAGDVGMMSENKPADIATESLRPEASSPGVAAITLPSGAKRDPGLMQAQALALTDQVRREASEESIEADKLTKSKILLNVRQGVTPPKEPGVDPKLAAMMARRAAASDVELDWDGSSSASSSGAHDRSLEIGLAKTGKLLGNTALKAHALDPTLFKQDSAHHFKTHTPSPSGAPDKKNVSFSSASHPSPSPSPSQSDGASAPSSSQGKGDRGPCTICGELVLTYQEREKHSDGKRYTHVACLEGSAGGKKAAGPITESKADPDGQSVDKVQSVTQSPGAGSAPSGAKFDPGLMQAQALNLTDQVRMRCVHDACASYTMQAQALSLIDLVHTCLSRPTHVGWM